MGAERIDGIKFNLEAMDEDELRNIHGHLLARHAQITQDIETIESHLFRHGQPELPLDEDYPVIGEMGYMVVHEALESGDN